MYDYLDRPIGALDEGNRFLVWAMRGWTQGMAERRCPPCMLGPGFSRSGLDATLPHFQRAMATLNRHGLDQMGFGTMDCPQVSEAEAILLAIIAHYAGNRVRQGDATIALLVHDAEASVLRSALLKVAIGVCTRFPADHPPSGVDSVPNSGLKNGIDRGVDGE